MLTSEIFENSFFYIGAGFDFEPISRFSNVCKNYIYVTSHVNKDEVLLELEKLSKSSNLTLKNIEEIIDFEESTHLELNKNFESEVEEVMSVLSESEKSDYDQIFNYEIKKQKWLFKVQLVRNHNKITLWYLGGEGLRYLIMLSKGGKYMPKILSTIQTGCLEYVNGLNTRIINKIGKSPKVWVRGFEATPFLTDYYYQSKIFKTDKLFSEVGMDFGFSWNVNTSYIGYNKYCSTRYCKGYITKEYNNLIENTPFKKYKKNEIHKLDILKFVNDNIFNSRDLLIVTKKVFNKIKNIEKHHNILIWEDILTINFSNNNIMERSLNYLMKIDEEKIFEKIYFIPFGLEDESMILDRFLKKSYHSKMIPLVYRPLDLIDLREQKIL